MSNPTPSSVTVGSHSGNAVTSGNTSADKLVEQCLLSIREDMRDNPYIQEALRVLPVGGYRSAIGSFWNAVVDDLRNKIMVRSLPLFNKSVTLGRTVANYDDFQNHVNDDQLIDGAYKIGVIGWEASKILKHAKETRHIFHGHPRSSEPSIVKVLAVMDDCVRYVLNEEYPVPIIDIDEYVTMLGDQNFDRNPVAIENALTELPDIYKDELSNRLFTAYVHEAASSVLRSNIEFVLPILWKVLSKERRVQLVRRVDQVIPKGNSVSTEQAFAFVTVVGATAYLSSTARRYKIQPLVERLKINLDDWPVENEVVKELAPFAAVIPSDLLTDYVSALTHTYVGYVGASARFSRTDFYANAAAALIPTMFEAFDDRAAEAFVECIKTSMTLRQRIRTPSKMRRLRRLGQIVQDRVSERFGDRPLLHLLSDDSKEAEFLVMAGLRST